MRSADGCDSLRLALLVIRVTAFFTGSNHKVSGKTGRDFRRRRHYSYLQFLVENGVEGIDCKNTSRSIVNAGLILVALLTLPKTAKNYGSSHELRAQLEALDPLTQILPL